MGLSGWCILVKGNVTQPSHCNHLWYKLGFGVLAGEHWHCEAILGCDAEDS